MTGEAAVSPADGVQSAAVQAVASAKAEGVDAQATAPVQAEGTPVSSLRGFMQAPTLGAVMKKNAYIVAADAPVYRAVDLMIEHHTSGLPVVDGAGRVVGFVSDGDIMKSLADQGSSVDLTYSLSVYANDSDFDERMESLMHENVMDIATHRVISVDESTSIERVCAILGERRIKKVPVLQGGMLVGTISRTDVNRYLMSSFAARGRADAGIE